MKPSNPESEINPPPEMLARAAFVAMFLLFLAGLVLVVAGLVEQQWRTLGAGGAAWFLAGVTRHWLVRIGKFEELNVSFDGVVSSVPRTAAERCSELVKLLHEWEVQEKRRGSADFDPWTLQALRNDIRAIVESDPALQDLFHDHHGQRRAA